MEVLPIQCIGDVFLCARHRLIICETCHVDLSKLRQELYVGQGLKTPTTRPHRLLIEHEVAPIPRDTTQTTRNRSSSPETQPTGGIDRVRTDYILDLHARQGALFTFPIHLGLGQNFYPAKFVPPSPTIAPYDLFPPSTSHKTGYPVRRYVHRDDGTKFLIFTAGASVRYGQSDAGAGWAFAYNSTRLVSGRLEAVSPFGDCMAQTANRAELRAVIGLLRYYNWTYDGFETVVIATDSEYVTEGATQWLGG